jgi:hypothetical protein
MIFDDEDAIGRVGHSWHVSATSRAGRPLVDPRIRGRDNGATAGEVMRTVH